MSVDLSNFNAALSQLKTLSGKDHAAVMKAETGKILETAVRYSPKASEEKIREQATKDAVYRFHHGETGQGVIYETKAGNVWFSPGDKAKWLLILDWKVPDPVWRAYLAVYNRDKADLSAAIQKRVEQALARRGLTAKTWIQIGSSLGVTVKAPDFIAKAGIPEGIGSATVQTGSDSATIEGRNSSLVLTQSGKGQGIINRAIKARAKYLEIAIEKGALRTLQTRAKAFPHLFPQGDK